MTSQLAAYEECQQGTGHETHPGWSEAPELSRQKVLEAEHFQKIMEEKRNLWENEHQNKELQI